MFRYIVREHAVAQQLDHVGAVQPARHADRQALAGELVDHYQRS